MGDHSPCEFLSECHLFEILDGSGTVHKSTDTYLIRANQRLRFHERRYRWTGSGVHKDPVILSGYDASGRQHHRLHGPVVRHGEWHIFLVDLGRDLAVGEEETVKFEQKFIDEARTFNPFHNVSIRQPRGYVELRLKLPEALAINVRACESSMVPDGPVRADQTLEKDPESGEFIYRVERPVIGHSYAIRWM